jgi:hypothetical protein
MEQKEKYIMIFHENIDFFDPIPNTQYPINSRAYFCFVKPLSVTAKGVADAV